MLKLGYSETDITPKKPVQLIGFSRDDNTSCGVLKPLIAQAAVWENEEKCCLVTIDSIGFTTELADLLRDRIGRVLGIPREKVMLCFSHTHAAPDADTDREYYDLLCDRAEESVSRAAAQMKPVSAGWTNASAVIGVNRRKASDMTDDRIGILKLCSRQTEKPELLILRVTAHGNVLKRDNRMVSPDYFGDVRETAAAKFHCPVMVIQGAAGNTAPKYFCSGETPVDAATDQFIRSDNALADMARVITESVETKFNIIPLRDSCPIRMFSRQILLASDVPSVENASRIAAEAKASCGIADTGWLDKVTRLNAEGIREQAENVEMQFFSIGDWCLCGGPYEFMVGFALESEKLLEDEFFYLNGYTNGCLLYFPTEDEYDLGGYEVFWSMLIYYRYIDRVFPFRREEASRLIRFVTECIKEGRKEDNYDATKGKKGNKNTPLAK